MARNANPLSYIAHDALDTRIDDRETEREVVATAPLRIDLTGGFTDVPPFGLCVDSLHINAAFDLGVMVRCRSRRDRQICVSFAGEGDRPAADISEGRRRFLEALRVAVAEFAHDGGFDLLINSDAPAGSGLGSSGAILVAAIKGCAHLTGTPMSPSSAAAKAIDAATAAGIVGGSQDEFAAAHGSLRAYVFQRRGTSQILDLPSAEARTHLENTLLVVQMSAGGRRADIVAEVAQAVRSGHQPTISALHYLQDLAHTLYDVMSHARFEELTKCLKRIRDAQCALHEGIRCPTATLEIEAVRETIPGLEYKMLGGGGTGSCALVFAPPHCKAAAVSMLARHAGRIHPVKIHDRGVVVRSIDNRKFGRH